PVYCCTSRELVPNLIDDTGDGIAPSFYQQLAWNFREMLSVFRPSQASGQFQVGQHIVVRFSKCGVGVQNVRILAAEIIVTVAVYAIDRIRIDISTSIWIMYRGRVWKHKASKKARRIVRNARHIAGVSASIQYSRIAAIRTRGSASCHIGRY